MKKIISLVIALVIITLLVCPAYSKATNKKHVTNRDLVERYVKKHYSGLKIVYVRNAAESDITNRRGTVLVEIIKSVSHGRHGYTRDGYYIAYNRKVRKGKTVTSYAIYNPDNNCIDDVVAVVDNEKVR